MCFVYFVHDQVYHWNYAISLENQCFYYKAEDAYKRAINLDFTNVDAHLNYAHMLETMVCSHSFYLSLCTVVDMDRVP